MPALDHGAVIVPKRAMPPRAGRGDTLIASAVLILLLAGWIMNFIGPRQLAQGVGTLLAHGFARQA